MTDESDLFDAECKLCPLHTTAASVCILGDGPLDSDLLVLGRNPGWTEDRDRRVFVGKSGQILRNALVENGLGHARIENTVRCVTPDDREPHADEVRSCRVYLDRVVARMPNLKYVVALGTVAMRACGVQGSVIDLAGIPQRARAWDRDLVVVPLLHPAAILRRPVLASTWDSHWHQIRELVRPSETSFADKARAVLHVQGGGMFNLPNPNLETTIDLETTSLDPRKGSVLSVSLTNACGTHSLWVDTPDVLKLIRSVFTRSGDEPRRVVHFAAMEGRWAEHFFGLSPRQVDELFVDTALLAYRVDPGQPMKLASVVARHLPEFSGWKRETEALLKDPDAQGSMLGLPPEEVLKRGAVDTHVTHTVKKILWEKLSDEERALHGEDVAIELLTARMADRGLFVDEDRLIALRRSCTETMDRERAWLRSFIGISDLNPGSPIQLAKVFTSRGVELPKTDTGRDSVNGVALRVLRFETKDENLVQLVDHVLAFRKAQDMLGDNVTQYAQALDADGRMRGGLFWPGTVTWRPASRDPNKLNVPRSGVRHIFTAPPGYSFLEIDLAQAELRVSAALSQDPVLCAAYRRGVTPVDLHTRRAQAIYGRDTVTKSERYVGKKINFSTEYGAGPFALWESLAKEDVHVPIDLVAKGRASFWKDHAILEKHIQDVVDRAARGDTIYAPTGAYRWKLEDMALLHPRDEEEALRSIFNATVQSAPTRIMYRIALEVERRISTSDFELVLQTYDGLLGYVRTDIEQDVLRAVHPIVQEKVAAETWLGDIELPGDYKLGPSWGQAVEVKP